jgi:hypothetical protein
MNHSSPSRPRKSVVSSAPGEGVRDDGGYTNHRAVEAEKEMTAWNYWLDVIIASEATMGYSQQELNEQWRILKERPANEYAEARITADSELVRGLEFDVPVTFGSSVNTNKTVAFTQRRESPGAEWGEWEEGNSASV